MSGRGEAGIWYAVRMLRGAAAEPWWVPVAQTAEAGVLIAPLVWNLARKSYARMVGVGVGYLIYGWVRSKVKSMGNGEIGMPEDVGYTDIPIPLRLAERNGRTVVEIVGGQDDGTVLEPGGVYTVLLNLQHVNGFGLMSVTADIRALPEPPYVSIKLAEGTPEDVLGIVTPGGALLAESVVDAPNG